LDFNKYLRDQKALQSGRRKKKEREKDEPSSQKSISPKFKKSKNPIDMNVMFPKKRKRKYDLGTNESEDPRCVK